MLDDDFGRSHPQDYRKPRNTVKVFKPSTGVHSLLVSEKSEHEYAPKNGQSSFIFHSTTVDGF